MQMACIFISIWAVVTTKNKHFTFNFKDFFPRKHPWWMFTWFLDCIILWLTTTVLRSEKTKSKCLSQNCGFYFTVWLRDVWTRIFFKSFRNSYHCTKKKSLMEDFIFMCSVSKTFSSVVFEHKLKIFCKMIKWTFLDQQYILKNSFFPSDWSITCYELTFNTSRRIIRRVTLHPKSLVNRLVIDSTNVPL